MAPNDGLAADREPETGPTEVLSDETVAALPGGGGQPVDVIATLAQASPTPPALDDTLSAEEKPSLEDRTPSEEGLLGEDENASEGKRAAKASEDDTAERTRLEQQVKKRIGEKRADKAVFPLYEVPTDVLNKYEFIFVPPAGYLQVFAILKNTENRVFLVHGDDPEWNFVCGTQLGIELIRDRHDIPPAVMVYRRDASDTRSLIDFVRQRRGADAERLKTAGTVYVIEDAFQRGIRSEDLNDISLGHLNAGLGALQSYLVLTVSLQRVDSISGLETLSTQVAGDTLPTLFDKLLKYYQEGRAAEYIAVPVLQMAGNVRPDLLDKLTSYTLVKRFFSTAASLSVNCKPDDMIEKAKAVAQASERESGDRFRSLSPNAKLYAMLAVVFDNVEKRIVDEIYMAAVQELRRQGLNNLRDARQFGLLDMLEEIQADLSPDGRIDFRSSRFKDHVCRQQLANHHHLLWSLIEMLCALIEQYRAEAYAGFRESLGSAIGQLGGGHESRFFDLAEKLALHKDGRVASVSAYALEEFCRRHPKKFELVAALITRWAESLDPDLMWAAGVAIGRIYRVIAPEVNPETAHTSRLQDILTNLAASVDRPERIQEWLEHSEDFDGLLTQLPSELHDFLAALVSQGFLDVVASSIGQAIYWIATHRADDAVALISRWLEADPGTHTSELGLRMAVQLFQESNSDEVMLVERVHRPRLGLVAPLLQTAVKARSTGSPDCMTETRAALNAVFQTLETWLTQNTENEWASAVHGALLRVVNRATLDERRMLQGVLTAHLLASENARTRHIGQALNARCAAMDGLPMDLPGRRYGVIALDASNRRGWLPFIEAVRSLYLHLDGRVDTYLVMLGNAQVAIGPAQIPPLADFRSQGDFPRLLAAVLARHSALNPAQTYFVLAVSGGPILDAEDLDSSAWQDKLIVTGPDPTAKWRDDLSFVGISRNLDDDDLRRIENRVSQQLGQRLAVLDPDDWWPTLAPYLSYAPTDLDGICAQLSAWATNLDHVEDSKHPGDVTHTIACTVLWLAKVEFDRCLALLKAWLLQTEDETRRIMGLACAKLLLNVYCRQTPPARFETLGPILGIVPALVQARDWGAILAVLQAIHTWLRDPAWASHILTSSAAGAERGCDPGVDLLTLLADHTPAVNRNDLKQLLGTWRAEKDAPDALRQAADRLLIRLLLGEGGKLPDLPAGQQYGLILLDASRTRGHLARVAAQLAKELQANTNTKDKFYPLICRLGQKIPVAVKGQTPTVEELTPAGLYALPRLAGPALDTLMPQQVGFVTALCNGVILDEEDWHERWKGVPAFAYSSPFGKEDWATSFRVIRGQRTEQDAAVEITRFILNSLKG